VDDGARDGFGTDLFRRVECIHLAANAVRGTAIRAALTGPSLTHWSLHRRENPGGKPSLQERT
jgi:hypothetical protein